MTERSFEPHRGADVNKIGEVIRRLREGRGLDQMALADRAGVSQQAISKIELGLSAEPKSLPRLCKVLGVTVDEVLEEAGGLEENPQRVRTKPGARAPRPDRAPRARWPFLLPYQRFERLTHSQKLHVEAILIEAIAKIEDAQSGRRAQPVSRAPAAKPRH